MFARRSRRRVPGGRRSRFIPGLGMLIGGIGLASLLTSCKHSTAFEPAMTEAILFGYVTDESGAPVAGVRTIFQDFDTDCTRTITAPDSAVSTDSSGRYRHVVFAHFAQCERLVIEPINTALLRPDTVTIHGMPWRHSYPLDSLRVDRVLHTTSDDRLRPGELRSPSSHPAAAPSAPAGIPQATPLA